MLMEAEVRAPRDEAFEGFHSLINASRYDIIPLKNYPSPIFFVFDRPLLLGDSLGWGGFYGTQVEVESLRVVSIDGKEWGEVQVDALTEVDQEAMVFGQQCEGYESWEDRCLVKFNVFSSVSTMGYENKILDLLQKMVSQQPRAKRKGNSTKTKCKKKLRKFECSINYNGQSSNRGVNPLIHELE